MKYFIKNTAIGLIGLGMTLSIFEFLLENSFAVLVAGLLLFFVSFLVGK